MLKCVVHKNLFQHITSQIWQEKVLFELEDLIGSNTLHKGWVADPRETVLTKLLDADSNEILYVPGMCFPINE